MIYANWPAPSNVTAFITTRERGASRGIFSAFNLGDHVGDEPSAVHENRSMLQDSLGTSRSVCWLKQVHSNFIVAAEESDNPQEADAIYTYQKELPVAVMTADCLPVFFASKSGDQVAVAHAGWRGLCAGVLENTANCFAEPSELLVWLGPAIGQKYFEVGDDVRSAFVAKDLDADQAFLSVDQSNKYLADLYLLAKLRLQQLGISAIYGGDFCTYSDTRFYSYRREGQTGRMASVIFFS